MHLQHKIQAFVPKTLDEIILYKNIAIYNSNILIQN